MREYQDAEKEAWTKLLNVDNCTKQMERYTAKTVEIKKNVAKCFDEKLNQVHDFKKVLIWTTVKLQNSMKKFASKIESCQDDVYTKIAAMKAYWCLNSVIENKFIDKTLKFSKYKIFENE